VLEPIKQGVSNFFGNIFGGKDEGPVYDDSLSDFVEKEFKRRQDERRPFEMQWRLNLCFADGNQYVDINTASWSLEEQPILYDWQERERSIQPYCSEHRIPHS